MGWESLRLLGWGSVLAFERMRFYLPTLLALMCESPYLVTASQWHHSVSLVKLLSEHFACDDDADVLYLSLAMGVGCLCRRSGRCPVLSMLSVQLLSRCLTIRWVA